MVSKYKGEMTMNKPSFHEFAYTPQQEWIQEVKKALKDDPHLYEKETFENILLKTLYRKNDVQDLPHLKDEELYLFVRGIDSHFVSNEWNIAQRINVAVPKKANQMIKEALDNGQTSLAIELNPISIKGKNPLTVPFTELKSGVLLSNYADLCALFKDIQLPEVPLFIPSGYTALPLIESIDTYCQQEGITLSQVAGVVGMDPLGSLAEHAHSPIPITDLYHDMANAIAFVQEKKSSLKTVLIDTKPYHMSGATAVQELAYALSTAVQYTDECLRRNIPLHHVLPHLAFSFSTSSQLFMEVSKLRAFRLLWLQAVRAFSQTIDVPLPFIHVNTSIHTLSSQDLHTNILRGTLQAFAGIIGGANSLHVYPYDAISKQSTELSNRLARNTQLMLREESQLGRVIDPAGGSWYIESYTHELAEKAWKLFQKMESKGGMEACLESGWIQCELQHVSEEKREQIHSRNERMVGITHYVSPSKTTYEEDNVANKDYHEYQLQLRNELTASSLLVNAHEEQSPSQAILFLNQWRKSEAFEQMRETTKGLTIGCIELSESKLVKQQKEFAYDFFQSGGFQCETFSPLYHDLDTIEWLKKRPCHAYVVCGEPEQVKDMLAFLNGYKQEKLYVFVVAKSEVDGAAEFINENVNAINCFTQLVRWIEVNQHV